MRLEWSDLAIEQATALAHFIARDDAAAARKWVDVLFVKAQRLADYPQSGRVVPEIKRADIREIMYGDYRIVYRVEPARVAILTVRHGARKLDADDLDI